VIADYEQEAKERCTRALARARAKLTAETLTQADLDWLGVEDYESDEGTIGSPSIAINDAGNLVAWEPVPSSLDDEAPWDAVSEETEIPALVVARIRAWRTRDGGRITGAEFAAYRHLIGLTVDELASALRVNPRTARSWESGRDPIPARVAEELEALAVEHRALARRMADDGRPVAIRRDKTAPTDKPRGWYVAAAARALVIEPDLEVEWV
jgi:transcriptional regulator with XRE-family HTH domain